MNTILAIDQGTSSTRARLYTTEGRLLFNSQAALATQYPQPGWVEQKPQDILDSVMAVLREVRDFATDKKIIGCGIANQRETSLLWQRSSGRCLGPALVWQDRRTAEFCRQLQDAQQCIHEKTGLFPDPYFSASKIHWMLAHYPDVARLLAEDDLAFGTVDSYLLWQLSGGSTHKIEISNASRTLLFNLHTLDWDPALLARFSIPRSILPEIVPSVSDFAEIEANVFGYPVPIFGVAGDQQAALIGQSAFKSGMVKATFGTGAFLLMNNGKTPCFSKNKLLTTIAYQVGETLHYGLEGSIYQAGTMIKWLRDSMGILGTAADSEWMAESLTHNDGVYLLPAFTGMGAPYWETRTGGRIHGLSLDSRPAHFARAALEAVAYQTWDVLQCMQKDSAMPIHSMRVDGGMVVNNWLLQRLATQCRVQVHRPADIETTAFGVAMLAAVGCKIADSLEDLNQYWSEERCFSPRENDYPALATDYRGWQALVDSYLHCARSQF